MSAHANYRGPSDEDFKIHSERLFNSPQLPHDDENATDINSPILDDTISPTKVCDDMSLRPDKVSGPNGLSPDIFSLLPAHLILMIVALLNKVFLNVCPLRPGLGPKCSLFSRRETGIIQIIIGVSVSRTLLQSCTTWLFVNVCINSTGRAGSKLGCNRSEGVLRILLH